MTRRVGSTMLSKLPAPSNAGTREVMARRRKTPETSKIARVSTVAYARKQKPAGEGGSDDEDTDPEREIPAGLAEAAAKPAEPTKAPTPPTVAEPPKPAAPPIPAAPSKPAEAAKPAEPAAATGSTPTKAPAPPTV